jgi:hypothetical protein
LPKCARSEQQKRIETESDLAYANSFIVFPIENQAELPPDFDSILALSAFREEMTNRVGHVSSTHSGIQRRKELLQVLSRPWVNALGAQPSRIGARCHPRNACTRRPCVKTDFTCRRLETSQARKDAFPQYLVDKPCASA